MQMLLLYNDENKPFAAETIRRIFESENRFQDVRSDGLVGSVIEADYIDGQDSSIVRLSDNLETLSLSGTSDAALCAALTLQNNLQGPLHIIDLDYSFDLVLKDFKDIEELKNAITNAQAT
jgi:hypothetical protein